MFKSKNFIVAVSVLFLVSCGGGKRTPAATGEQIAFGGQNLTVLGESGELTVGPESIKGTGSILFQSALNSVTENSSYEIYFQLEDGGSLTLYSHANSALAAGYEMEFRRQGSGAGSLKVTLRASGNTRNTLDERGVDVFGGLDAAKLLRFQIDVHNEENPAHVLLWTLPLGRDFTEDGSIFNTGDARDKSNGSPGNGTSTRWGLALKNATLLKAEKSAQKYVE
jgi:hypothetical protein